MGFNPSTRRHHRGFIRWGAGSLIATALAVGGATPVAAHDPIFLTDEQTTPDTGPYLPDGAISWAIYGTFDGADDTRGFEFDLRSGEELFLSLLIPNLEPETSLPETELPVVEITMPDGEVRPLEADRRDVFDEPFSGTSYVTLLEVREPATSGRHQVLVTSRGPSRFTVAVGEREEFFTPAERTVDRPTSFPGISEPLNAWYQTPPGGAPVTDGTEVEIDVDMVESELDALDEEGSTSAPSMVEQASTDADDPASDSDATAASVERAGPEAEQAEVVNGDGEDAASLGWVAPVVLITAIVGAGGIFLARRRRTS